MGFPSFCLLVCLLLAASSLISGTAQVQRRRRSDDSSHLDAPRSQPLEGCGSCDESRCRPPNANGDKPCLAGVIKDVCGCCYVCALIEGQRCHPLSPGVSGPSGCGENLACRIRTDLPPEDPPEALCVCKKNDVLCGSDGKTYLNECQLTEARYRKRVEEVTEDREVGRQRRFVADSNSNLIQLTTSDEDPLSLRAVSRGPCKSAPKIVSPPEDVTNHTGHFVALSCEATGWPVPVIEWSIDRGTGNIVPLPSDDSHVAVQSRGGPSNYEVTSWLQLLKVVADDQATYWCVAKNEMGEDSASGKVTVLKNKPGNSRGNSRTNSRTNERSRSRGKYRL